MKQGSLKPGNVNTWSWLTWEVSKRQEQVLPDSNKLQMKKKYLAETLILDAQLLKL